MKKCLSVILTGLILSMLVVLNTFNAATLMTIPKVESSGVITYRGTSIPVQVVDAYPYPDSEFRAVWISNLLGEIGGYNNEASWRVIVANMINLVRSKNINAVIYHLRTHNNAMYNSKLNPLAVYWNQPNYDVFDPLTYLIDECHKYGIEFHAWLNPYRLPNFANVNEYAASLPETNIAHNPDYIITGGSTPILNPGEPAVREFLIDTCMEIVENYDVDAIHFDDYFYVSGLTDSSDAATRAKYNPLNLSVANWRRYNSDELIRVLSNTIRAYNESNGKYVQLGISPTPVWQNGSTPYNESTSNPYFRWDTNVNLTNPIGPYASAFTHYGSYLYADTKKWIDNEWIDYIVPQIYHGFEHSSAPYADIAEWWNACVKHKKVNFYAGSGVYRYTNETGWKNEKEAYHEVLFNNTKTDIKGLVLFSYTNINNSAVNYLVNNAWKNPVVQPEIKIFDPIILNNVSNFNVSKVEKGYRIDFSKVVNAKSYIIYKSTNPITFDSSEIIDIVGDNAFDQSLCSYFDSSSTLAPYYYGVRVLSKTNSMNEGVSKQVDLSVSGGLVDLGPINNIIFTDNNMQGATIQLVWDQKNVLFGGTMVYEVYRSLNGVDWTKLAGTPLISTGKVSLRIRLDTTSFKTYLKIRAFNDIGESYSGDIIIDTVKNYGSLFYFISPREIFSNEIASFVFAYDKIYNKLAYTLEYSLDNFSYTKLDTTTTLYEYAGYAQALLPNITGKVYIRLSFEDAQGKGLSDEIEYNLRNRQDITNILINNKPYEGLLVFSSNEIYELSWDYVDPLTYNVFLSSDMISWRNPRQFYSANPISPTITNNTASIKLVNPPIIGSSTQYYNYYIRIEVTSSTLKGNSYILRVVNGERVENKRFFVGMYDYIKFTGKIILG